MNFSIEFKERVFYLSIIQALGNLIAITNTVLWTNFYSAEDFGIYLTFLALFSLFNLISMPGLPTFLEKYGASSKISEARGLLKVKLVNLLYFSIPFGFCLYIFGYLNDIENIFFMTFCFVLQSIGITTIHFYLGSGKLIKYTFLYFSSSIPVLFCLLINYFLLALEPYEIIVIQSIIVFTISLLSFGLGNIKEIDSVEIKKIKKLSNIFSLNILLKTDRILIENFLGSSGLAFYHTLFSLSNLLQSIQTLLMKILTPTILKIKNIRILIKSKLRNFLKIQLLLFSFSIIFSFIGVILYQYIFPESYREYSFLAGIMIFIYTNWILCGIGFNVGRLNQWIKFTFYYTFINLFMKVSGILSTYFLGLSGAVAGHMLAMILSCSLVIFWFTYSDESNNLQKTSVKNPR